jgi:hypothetical protein
MSDQWRVFKTFFFQSALKLDYVNDLVLELVLIMNLLNFLILQYCHVTVCRIGRGSGILQYCHIIVCKIGRDIGILQYYCHVIVCRVYRDIGIS